VPDAHPTGPASIVADFDSGPLAGSLHATTTIEVAK
jgi:hypothetical protein